ncbi:MAG: hypothetical protein E7K04_01805 [Helicobacter sp.]|nr:hypothetical protein [Helicobacter sp.]
MYQEIILFLEQNHILTLALQNGKSTHCASVFYAYAKINDCHFLIFKSNSKSLHSKLLKEQKNCSVSIHNNETNVLKIQGAQIRADLAPPAKNIKEAYYQKYPFARVVSGQIYALNIISLKYTNNALRKKLFFNKTF